jgi:PAS domain S-box-containing protein
MPTTQPSANPVPRSIDMSLNGQTREELIGLLHLHEISTKLVAQADLPSLLDAILEAAIALTGADKGNIQLVDSVTGALKIYAQRGFQSPFLKFFEEVHHGRGASCGAAKETGQRVIVEDVAESAIFRGTPALCVLLAEGVHAVQSTPLFGRSGQIFGVLSTHFSKPYRPSEGQLRVLDLLAGQAADAIERTGAQQALRESEERLAYALDATTEGVWDWNIKTGQVLFSRRWIDSLGYAPEEVPPHVSFWESIVHPDDMPTVKKHLQDHFEGRTSVYVCENRLRMKSGEYRWNLDRGRVVEWDTNGQPLRMVGADTDITERKRAEAALERRTAQFETLLNEAPLGVYLVDADFRIRQVNPVARPVFGDIPDLIGRDFDEVIHVLWPKAYADEIVERFRHTLDTGEAYFVAERIEERRDRGVREYYEWQINRISLSDGRHGVVCYFRDISAQVRAREVIAESEERYRAVMASMGEGLYALDQNGLVAYVNPAAEKLLGWTSAELLGHKMHDVVHYKRPDGRPFPAEDCPGLQVLREGKILTEQADKFIRRDGSFFDVFYSSSPVISGGEITGLVVGFRDVTEQNRADRERERLLTELQQERLKLQQTQRALEEKVNDLEAFHDVAVGRELKMIDLERHLARLREQNAALKPQSQSPTSS